MADSYLGNLLTQATKLSEMKVKTQQTTQSKVTRTNLAPVRKGIIETNNSFRPSKEATVKYGVQRILKQAQAYDPFAVTNKTPEEMKKPFSYFQQELDKIKPSVKYVLTYFGRKKIVDSDPTAEYNRQILTELIAKQNESLGSDLSKLDNKLLPVIDWKSFYGLSGKIAEYQSLRKSVFDKQNKTQNDYDKIKQYDILMNNIYKDMGVDREKTLQSSKVSYDTILNTKNTSIDAIKAFLPDDKKQTRTVLDVGNTNQRDMIANRVKKINELTGQATKKVTPIFSTRPI